MSCQVRQGGRLSEKVGKIQSSGNAVRDTKLQQHFKDTVVQHHSVDWGSRRFKIEIFHLPEPLPTSIPNRMSSALHDPPDKGRAGVGKMSHKVYFAARKPCLHVFARSHRVNSPAHLYRWSKLIKDREIHQQAKLLGFPQAKCCWGLYPLIWWTSAWLICLRNWHIASVHQ